VGAALHAAVDRGSPWRHAVGDRWFVDETYVKVSGRWRHVRRGVDQEGQVIDVYVSPRRDLIAAHRFFSAALSAHGEPVEVMTDLAELIERSIEELVSNAFHNTGLHANNRIECDHGRLKARLRPMRGLKTDRTATVAISDPASCRTCDQATTNLDSTPTLTSGQRPPSMNSSK
jgi:IS6 family transposase